MHTEGFNLESFISGTILLVIVPTAVCIYLLKKGLPGANSPSKTLLKGGALAFLVGFFAAAVWLAWSPTSGLSDFLQHGAPTNFSQWQIISCGTTVVIGSTLVSLFFSKSFKDVLTISLITGAGFGMAFSAGVSFGPTSQEGVGIFFSFIGISLLCAFLNSMFFALFKLFERKAS